VPAPTSAHCPMGTVTCVLVRRIASPEHASFGGLYSGLALVAVRLHVVSPPPRSFTPDEADCSLVGGPAGSDRGVADSELREGCPRTTTDVSRRCSRGIFDRRSSDGLCARLCLVLVCRGRYGLKWIGSPLHSGIEFGRSKTGEGSSGWRKKGVV
jgi:hypothetical protein